MSIQIPRRYIKRQNKPKLDILLFTLHIR